MSLVTWSTSAGRLDHSYAHCHCPWSLMWHSRGSVVVTTSMHPLFLSSLSLVWHVPTYVAAIMEIENGSISSLIWMKVFAHTHTRTHTVSHTCANCSYIQEVLVDILGVCSTIQIHKYF